MLEKLPPDLERFQSMELVHALSMEEETAMEEEEEEEAAAAAASDEDQGRDKFPFSTESKAGFRETKHEMDTWGQKAALLKRVRAVLAKEQPAQPLSVVRARKLRQALDAGVGRA